MKYVNYIFLESENTQKYDGSVENEWNTVVYIIFFKLFQKIILHAI